MTERAYAGAIPRADLLSWWRMNSIIYQMLNGPYLPRCRNRKASRYWMDAAYRQERTGRHEPRIPKREKRRWAVKQ